MNSFSLSAILKIHFKSFKLQASRKVKLDCIKSNLGNCLRLSLAVLNAITMGPLAQKEFILLALQFQELKQWEPGGKS